MSKIDYRMLFEEIRTVAVVGYSDNPDRAGFFVPDYLARHGYEIIAINPRFGTEVNGFPCYPNLRAIPPGTRIDVLDIFRTPSAVPAVVEEASGLDPLPAYFWMQPGAVSQEAAAAAEALGMTVIAGPCMLAEHRKLGR
jgi:predicted CoA-binding protein